jgi:hypothetical protein
MVNWNGKRKKEKNSLNMADITWTERKSGGRNPLLYKGKQ